MFKRKNQPAPEQTAAESPAQEQTATETPVTEVQDNPFEGFSNAYSPAFTAGEEAAASPQEATAEDTAEGTEEDTSAPAPALLDEFSDTVPESPDPENTALQELKAELEETRRELAALKEDTPPAEQDEVTEPNPADYTYGEVDPAFIEARREYDRGELRKEILREQESARAEEAAQAESSQLAQQWENIAQSGAEQFEDFAEVVYGGAQRNAYALSDVAAKLIPETGSPTQIIYHLAKNPTYSQKLAQMSELAQAREIGRLEAALSTANTQAAPAPMPKAAPPPRTQQPRGAGGKFESLGSVNDFAVFEAHMMQKTPH